MLRCDAPCLVHIRLLLVLASVIVDVVSSSKESCATATSGVLESGGYMRQYALELPSDGTKPTGLIVAMLGGAQGYDTCSGICSKQIVAETGAAVVCPSPLFASTAQDIKNGESLEAWCSENCQGEQSTEKGDCKDYCGDGKRRLIADPKKRRLKSDTEQWCADNCPPSDNAKPETVKWCDEYCSGSSNAGDGDKVEEKGDESPEKCWQAFPGGGYCQGSAEGNADGNHDVVFLEELIQHLLQKYSINPGNVFIGGCSQGGSMAYRFLCSDSNLLTGVVIVAQEFFDPWLGYWVREGTYQCDPAHKPPVYAYVGTEDSYHASTQMQSWEKFSSDVYKCSGTKEVVFEDPAYKYGRMTCEEFPECAGKNRMCSILGDGHNCGHSQYAYVKAFNAHALSRPVSSDSFAAPLVTMMTILATILIHSASSL